MYCWLAFDHILKYQVVLMEKRAQSSTVQDPTVEWIDNLELYVLYVLQDIYR